MSGVDDPGDDGSFRPEAGAPTGGAAVPPAGTVLFSRYRVLRELGRGGMGVVLLAHDLELGMEVAIKLVPDLLVQDIDALDELKREVLRGMALTHPGIVRTHGFVRDDTMGAIVMEYVDGGHFSDLRRLQPGGCFDADGLLPWVEQLAAVLDYAHFEIGIAHRDLKPRNLMYTRAGRIKVADFGISSSLQESATRTTVQGSSSGTPAYMSPQQVMGERPSHLDDVYALGATLYELLTGKPPFYRGQILAQVLDCVPQPMNARREELGVTGKAAIPPVWEAVIAACLAKDPSQRPQSAGEVLQGLLQTPTESPSPPLAASGGETPEPPGRRQRKRRMRGRWAIPFVVLLAAIAGGYAFVESRKKAGDPAVAELAPPLDPLAILSPAELREGEEGLPYLHPLEAAGGRPPYAWKVRSGVLPEGLSLDPANGEIRGTPVSAGSFAWVTGILDATGSGADKPMSVVIRASRKPPEPPSPGEVAEVAESPILGPEPPPAPDQKETPAPVPTAPKIPVPFENSLGMRFVESGTPDVLMSVWLTRVRDFRAFVEATGHDAKKGVYSILIGGPAKPGLHRHDWSDPGFPQEEDSPVCGVSWEDAKAFCKWLGEADLAAGKIPEGFEYRLPFAAEWRQALGPKDVGGKAPTYPWGNQWPPPVELATVCNLAGQELHDHEMPAAWVYLDGFRDEYPRTSPVDAFPGNSRGIKDLFGNLSQFCEDPGGAGNASRRILGGSWCYSTPALFDLNDIRFRAADVRVVDSGFRCVLVRK